MTALIYHGATPCAATAAALARTAGTAPAPLIIVSTFSRGGSSLTLQMLDAAGVACVGHAPDFEDARTTQADTLTDLLADLPTDTPCAVKLLEPQRLNLAPRTLDRPVRVVWLDRDPKQRAASVLKFSASLDPRINTNSKARKALAASFVKDQKTARRALQTAFPSHLQTLSFEQLVTEPLESAQALCYLAGLDPSQPRLEAMVACLHPRSPACLPHMLEIDLINTAERAAS